MKKIIRGLSNTIILGIGNLFSSIIAFFISIYIARYLGPTNFGVLAIVTTYVTMFSFLTLGGFSKVIAREGCKNINFFSKLFSENFGIQICSSLFAIIMIFISLFALTYPLEWKQLIIIISLILLLNGSKNFLSSVYIISEKFHFPSIIMVINKIIYAAFISLVIIFKLSIFFIIYSLLISNIITLIIHIYVSKKIINFKFSFTYKLKKHILIPVIIFSLINLFTFLYSQIDIIMLSFLTTAIYVGFYSVAFKIVGIGDIFINQFTIAFFPVFVKNFDRKQFIIKKFKKNVMFMIIFSFVVCFIGSYISEFVIDLLYGSIYRYSSYLLKYLLWAFFFSFIQSPFILVLQALYKEKKILFILPFQSIINIVLNYLLFKLYFVLGIVYSTLITKGVFLIVFIIMTIKILREKKLIIDKGGTIYEN